MSRKPKFRPQVTRVKLNPEQAVLTCVCYAIDKIYVPNAEALENSSYCMGGGARLFSNSFDTEWLSDVGSS